MICGVRFNGTTGYTIYLEPGAVPYNFDGNEEVLRSIRWSDYAGVRLDLSQGNGDGLLLSDPNDTIFFAPDGLPRNNTGSLGSGTVFLTNNNNKTKAVSVSTTGNIRIN